MTITENTVNNKIDREHVIVGIVIIMILVSYHERLGMHDEIFHFDWNI